MICGSVELCSTSELFFFFFFFLAFFMMERRRGEGPRAGSSDLIGRVAELANKKKENARAIVKHGIDCYLTQNAVFLG